MSGFRGEVAKVKIVGRSRVSQSFVPAQLLSQPNYCSGVPPLCTAMASHRVRKRPAAAHKGDVGEYSSGVGPVLHPVAAHGGDAGEYSSSAETLVMHPPAAHEGNAGEYSSAEAQAPRRAPRRVRKRPSAAIPARYEADSFDLQAKQGEEPMWAHKTFDGYESPGIPWADNVVESLILADWLPRDSQKKVDLQLWSDCSGINSEKFAWNELQDAIRRIIGADVSLRLYYTCDMDPKSIAFAKEHHQPKHVGTDMSQRNFTDGVFWCDLQKENIPIPQSGVDLYVGTYPCSPWSRRGPRTGWSHPSVEAMRIGLQTLSYIQPAVWIIELGELPQSASKHEVVSDIRQVLESKGRRYIIQEVWGLGPQSQGYPIKRTRTYFLGWRGDVCPDADAAIGPLHTLMSHPVDMACSYRGFLKISMPYDWSGVGNFYVGAAFEYMSGLSCRCGCDPYILCPVHKCKCGNCGADGLQCTWRSHMQHFLNKENLLSQAKSMHGKMAYVHALEMQGGVAPHLPRSRLTLNVAAMLPQSQPLQDTLMIVDKSQNPGFGSWPCDGMAPTLTTNSSLWCMSAGRELKAWELALLMGFDTSKMVLKGHTESWFRTRLGMTVHVANFGLVLAAAMSQPLRMCLD